MGPTGLTIAACGVAFHRRQASAHGEGLVGTLVSESGYLVGVSLGQQAQDQMSDASCITIRRFEAPVDTLFPGGTDFLLMEVPQSSVARALGRQGLRSMRARSLNCVSDVKDPVIASLARAIVSVLERPAQASGLFWDQMGEVITTYLLEKYGSPNAPLNKTCTALPRHIEAKAKDMLRSRLGGSVSIAAIADACALSRSYFSKAFREATGSTPHQWLTRERLERARAMLKRDATTLADIAAACGFADQSHFTRVFTAAEGVSPGAWRKRLA